MKDASRFDFISSEYDRQAAQMYYDRIAAIMGTSNRLRIFEELTDAIRVGDLSGETLRLFWTALKKHLIEKRYRLSSNEGVIYINYPGDNDGQGYTLEFQEGLFFVPAIPASAAHRIAGRRQSLINITRELRECFPHLGLMNDCEVIALIIAPVWEEQRELEDLLSPKNMDEIEAESEENVAR